MKIVITKMSLGEFNVPVPTGLSQLLAESWVKNKKSNEVETIYDRQIIKDGSNFATVLKRKQRKGGERD